MYNQRPTTRPQQQPVMSATTQPAMGRTMEDEERNKSLNKLQNMCRVMAVMHQEEMHHCHEMGLQGFKRLHRHLAREWMETSTCVMNDMVDIFHDRPMVDIDHKEIETRDEFIIRLKTWHEQLHKFLAESNNCVSKLNSLKEYKASQIILNVICWIEKEIMYVHRHVQFVEDCKGDMGCIHWYSDKIHEKMKKKSIEDRY